MIKRGFTVRCFDDFCVGVDLPDPCLDIFKINAFNKIGLIEENNISKRNLFFSFVVFSKLLVEMNRIRYSYDSI